MGKGCKKSWVFGIFLGIMLFAAGFAFQSTTVETQAATTGFRTVSGKTYYYKNGKKVKGWLTLGGKKYFLNTKTGVLLKGWQKSSKGPKRYFDSRTGVMYTGMKKIGGKYYYFDYKTGYSKSGFVKAANGTVVRYFSPSTYTMATGWMTNSKNQKWYFASNGKMYMGLKKVGKYYYYFNPKTGIAAKGYVTTSGETRYFNSKYCRMVTGWTKSSKGEYRYFDSKGVMYKGLKKVGSSYYYFNTSNGIAAGGWVTISGNKYYFDKTSFKMVTGTKTIDGIIYTFNSSGVLTSTTDPSKDDNNNNNSNNTSNSYFANDPKPVKQTGSKTIKNYLAGALMPVGQALYIWGGGWNDSTLKGVKANWQNFYLSQSSSYNYNNYRDLSMGNRAKGLDCSGFVGWATYQVMQTKSDVGYGYTVVSGDIGSYYKGKGWGSIVNQNYLSQTNWKVYPGDIGYDEGHTWIILGQCSDKSAVIVHSTPNAGVQIAGTCTPSGNYNSEAVALAKKYMSRYAGYKKYTYNTSTSNYIRRGNYLRWYSSTLSDPDGYKNKTADVILKDLFGF
ncbi:N-acetylmuramoyl-L-alanine amidase family protein [Blautia sp. MSJ-19]|uniref:N-acetylmuramoyl-L-alanine amidase family protein n=1 Tax=Blautia sp. MSJ-19 TaxID=2841517 RepID=UPI001C0ED0BB|nr:cell wall-binding protein [Blautia sp. MSJ-19]MBU5480468.1 cell wall-binding protein [Blautia sp. MSJ-19]